MPKKILGKIAPEFSLYDTITGKYRSLWELKSGQVTVIMFLCNHCPYVKHILKELVSLVNSYIGKGVSFIAISSNDAENYPADSPQNMKELAENMRFPFPYLYDENQKTALDYGAEKTPEFMVFDDELICRYHGRFDESTPQNGRPVTGDDLKHAIESLLKEAKPEKEILPTVGCTIKWKPEIMKKLQK